MEGQGRETEISVSNLDAERGRISHEVKGYFSPPHPPKHFALIFASSELQEAKDISDYTDADVVFLLLICQHPPEGPEPRWLSFHAAPTSRSVPSHRRRTALLFWQVNSRENYQQAWELVRKAQASKVQQRAHRDRGRRNLGVGDMMGERAKAAALGVQ